MSFHEGQGGRGDGSRQSEPLTGVGPRQVHKLLRDREALEIHAALLELVLLTHGRPYVRVDVVGPLQVTGEDETPRQGASSGAARSAQARVAKRLVRAFAGCVQHLASP